ncbi:hypothetical protein R6Q59_031509 [Mikania micrantha]
MQNRGGKYKFKGLHPLKKFGQFAEIEDVDVAEEPAIPNVFIEEEHDVDVVSSKFSEEDVYVVKLPEYEDVLPGEDVDMDFDFEIGSQEVGNDFPEQVNLLITENLDALLEHVKRSVRNPPSASSFTEQELSLDVAADLIPRKRRRRDPRPGVIIREPETEHASVTQIQTTTTESTKPSPQIKELAAGKQVTRADRGKNVLPEGEPIDIVKLQSRVFELEQDSLYHTFLIQELKADNELNDKKIKDLETNRGHLSAIVPDLKQKLQDKFKGEFANESSPSTTSEPTPGISQAEFDELTRSREEGLRKYFTGDTGFKVSIAKSTELMMITDRTIQDAKDAAKFKPTGSLLTWETVDLIMKEIGLGLFAGAMMK